MSNLVSGANLPKDLLAVLEKYGLPDSLTAFKVECAGPGELLTITATFYARHPKPGETFKDVQETRVFKLLAVE